ncbi:MAG TPA: hypothetical protein DCM05_05260 [Elusimicrobia bacterium]|nr:hypothetical protein [Elusimicrobiota bacterium]
MRTAALLLATCCLPLRAAAFTSNPAGSTAQFLRLGVGARALGMGEAFGPVAEGAEALYWNPAGLARTDAPDAAYSHMELLRFFHHDHLAYAHPVPALRGTLGASMTLFYQDSLDLVSNTNQNLGQYSVHSEAYSLGYAHPFEGGACAGLAMKYVQETIYNRRAGGFAFDGGAVFRSRERPLALSAVFRNLGPSRRFINVDEDLPSELSFGAAYDWKGEDRRLLSALEAAFPYYGAPYAKLGFELPLPVGETARAAFRLGFKTLSATDLGALTGLTFGLGLGRGGGSFDFAFQPMAELGEVYRFSLGWKFGPVEERPARSRGDHWDAPKPLRPTVREEPEPEPARPAYREAPPKEKKPKPAKKEKKAKPRKKDSYQDGAVETPFLIR